MARSRFPERKKREDGTWGCRGCGGDIPKGRRTWCSGECVEKHDPVRVNHHAFKRDGGKCVLCRIDFVAVNKLQSKYEWECRAQRGITWEWITNSWAPYPKPEYDHIVPHSEGGPHVLENIRTLCGGCHRQVTADWRRKKAAERKALKKGTP